MQKKVEIKKKIDFSSMIGEISAISLENNLEFVNDNSIEGNFILLGKYKETAASRIEEDFRFEIPVEISLTNRVDPDTGKIEISDFYYDIVDGNSLLCNIEIDIDALEILDEDRECDGDPIEEKEIEIPHIENKEEITVVDDEREEQIKDNNSFFQIKTEEESYGTLVVYMVQENETINSIIEKYHTSIEEIEKYNDIKNITTGSKIIIPVSNEQDS
ncbi:MAG: LysM peptidoglycan-binding domain-containing protein [Bacilli bacterium]|nr:LysM peptidoglycan-binding domain-containing protein [Bacilli bacterium]